MSTRAVTSRVAVIVAAALLGGALAGWLTSPQATSAGEGPSAATISPASASAAEFAPRGESRRSRSARLGPARTGSERAERPERQKRAGQTGPSRRPAGPGVPRVLQIPSLDLRLPVRPEGVDPAGAMGLPDTVAAAGWYRFGPRPGSASGSAVIAGHVDTKEEGIGPLAALREVRVGATIRVDSGRGAVDYAVTSVDVVSRQKLDLSRIFARGGPPRLHVMTCGGAYLPEAGGYQSNVVVVAEPTARGVARPAATAITSGG